MNYIPCIRHYIVKNDDYATKASNIFTYFAAGMAKTAAERQRERREPLKQDGTSYEDYKKRDRQRKARTRAELSYGELTRLGLNNRASLQKHQAQLKAGQNASNKQNAYQTPAALANAKSRALQALPKSPSKRLEVLKELYSVSYPIQVQMQQHAGYKQNAN